MAQEFRFRSGIRWCFSIGVLAVSALLARPQSKGSLALLGLAMGLMFWVFFGTAYVVSDHGVLVQVGPMRRWVDAKLIERVRPTTTVRGALSGNRLEISGGFGAVVISPQDRIGFLRALKRVAPQLLLEGGLESTLAG